MKNALPIILFLVLFLLNQTTVGLLGLPTTFLWSLEALIAAITVIIIARIIVRKSFNVPLKYLLLSSAFFYVVVSGIILNDTSSLTVVAGIRTYFKYLPLLLLPLAFDYSTNDLKKQFIVLIILGLMQTPVALVQRFILYQNTDSGDGITGTLLLSGSLSIVLIGLIVIIFALYIKKLMSLKLFITLSIILLIPTTLNETKVTPILFITAFSALLFVLRKELTIKQLVAISGGGILLLVIFISAYNTFYSSGTDTKFVDKMSKEQLIDNYAYHGYKADPKTILDKQTNIVGSIRELPTKEMGRLDSIIIPINVLFNGDDVGKLFFGLGIGNVNSSRSNAEYTYINELGGAYTALAMLVWETGIIGALIFVLAIILIAVDSFSLAKKKGAWGAFSAGWFGVTLVILVTLIYNNMFHLNELPSLFGYFSSLIVIKKYVESRKLQIFTASSTL